MNNFKLNTNQKLYIGIAIFSIFLLIFLILKNRNRSRYNFKNRNIVDHDGISRKMLDQMKFEFSKHPFGYRPYKDDEDSNIDDEGADVPSLREQLEAWYKHKISEEDLKYDPLLSKVRGRALYKAEINPDYILGNYALEDGKLHEAEKLYRNAIQRDSTNPYTQLYCHGALMEVGRRTKNNSMIKEEFDKFAYWYHAKEGKIAESNGRYYVQEMPKGESPFMTIKKNAIKTREIFKKLLNNEIVPLEKVNEYLAKKGVKAKLTKEKLEMTIKGIDEFFPE